MKLTGGKRWEKTRAATRESALSAVRKKGENALCVLSGIKFAEFRTERCAGSLNQGYTAVHFLLWGSLRRRWGHQSTGRWNIQGRLHHLCVEWAALLALWTQIRQLVLHALDPKELQDPGRAFLSAPGSSVGTLCSLKSTFFRISDIVLLCFKVSKVLLHFYMQYTCSCELPQAIGMSSAKCKNQHNNKPCYYRWIWNTRQKRCKNFILSASYRIKTMILTAIYVGYQSHLVNLYIAPSKT